MSIQEQENRKQFYLLLHQATKELPSKDKKQNLYGSRS